VQIRLDDPLSSFRRHLPAAAEAPRTIELYGQSVHYRAVRHTFAHRGVRPEMRHGSVADGAS
jgi:hypothetical protein